MADDIVFATELSSLKTTKDSEAKVFDLERELSVTSS